MILGEIGDIHHFSCSAKLLTFAGLDLVYQSSNYSAKRAVIPKRNSKVLKYALVNATYNVVKNNATFKTYYDKKMLKSRSHCNALEQYTDKLVRGIWKILTDGVGFDFY